MRERVVVPLVEWRGGAHAESRAALLLAVVSGTWLFRHQLPVPPLTGAPDRATGHSGLVDGK
jgi:hypothetical protein